MITATLPARWAVWAILVAAGAGCAGCGGGGDAKTLAAPPLQPLPLGTGVEPPPGSGPQATLIGDSVASAIAESPQAEQALNRGMTTDLDLRACRRLVGTSCTFQGSTPPTALEAVQQRGGDLGSVLVVDVGYNDESAGYGDGLDQIVRLALRLGASRIVWVTLREAGPAPDTYRATNEEIRQATKRWPQLHVADWNAHSAGKPWFGGDGMHLSPEGGAQLALFLRPYITGQS